MVTSRPHPGWLHGWLAPLFLPWVTVAVSALFHTRTGFWPPIEVRVLHVVGATLIMAALLAVARPWQYRRPQGDDA